MTQGALFPLRVIRHIPPNGNGKDVLVWAVAEDGMEWALKRTAENVVLPGTELVCYQIALACGLAMPPHAILKDLDGALVFGSRIEGGLTTLQELPQDQVVLEIESCAGQMSACYALDVVLGNSDRHFGNFLFRRRASDGKLASLPIDYSRAWWVNGWPPVDVMSRSCATNTHISIMRGLGRWRSVEALMALGTLSSIPVARVERWVEDAPVTWITPTMRENLTAWWGSDAFHQRISSTVEHCR